MSDNCLGLNNGEPWGLQLTVELTVRSQMLTLCGEQGLLSGCGVRSSHCSGGLLSTGLAVPRHVGSSWTRDRTHVPCVCPTLCDPIDGSPPGAPVPGILQARTLEWVAISFSNA